MLRVLLRAGFYGLYRIGCFKLDRALITALVERWRRETHTFHLPIGEATITLQDVEVLWGLPVEGMPVTFGSSTQSVIQWQQICQRLLGIAPLDRDLTGGGLRIGWIGDHFSQLPQDADQDTIEQHARAHILHLIGGTLMPDKSQNRVPLMFLPLLEHIDQIGKYSWGSACLARLYRELCRASKQNAKDIAGPLVLLQVKILCFLNS